MSSLTLKSKPSEQAPVAPESSLLAGFCYIHFLELAQFLLLPSPLILQSC